MTKENVRAFQISGKKIAGNEYGGLPCAPQPEAGLIKKLS